MKFLILLANALAFIGGVLIAVHSFREGNLMEERVKEIEEKLGVGAKSSKKPGSWHLGWVGFFLFFAGFFLGQLF